MNLVLIETSGNQQYIFSTNKLRENVGASELTYRVGTEFVLDAVACAKLDKRFDEVSESQLKEHSLFEDEAERLRENLLNHNQHKPNPPIEGRAEASERVEVIIATSGKALLLVSGPAIGMQIISDVTMRALREAPGLSVHGVISMRLDSLEGRSEVHERVKEVHKRLEEARLQVPGVSARFLRLPFVEPCATSGFPASATVTFKPNNPAEREVFAYSSITLAKYGKREEGYRRLQRLAKEFSFPKDIDELQGHFEKLRWVAVIHADGNGLGQVFLRFADYVKKVHSDEPSEGRKYLNLYREFSLALDVCTVKAFTFAIGEMKRRVDDEDTEKRKKQRPARRNNEVPILPLVVGGDDLTVLCEGKYAVQFAHDFLTRFERETAKDQLAICNNYTTSIVRDIAEAAFHVDRFASCAGIAIIKPHFPVHSAYELAESLLRSAKGVKERVKHKIDDGQGNNSEEQLPCSALDYHILFDSSGVSLSRIRKSLQPDDYTRLYARPYIVTSDLSRATPESMEWFKPRTWDRLKDRIEAMRERGEDEDAARPKLPNSLLHELREGLFEGSEEADARMRLVRERYQKAGFDKLLAKPEEMKGMKTKDVSLFFDEEDPDGTRLKVTGFIDALDLVEFWADEDNKETTNARGAGGTQQ